MVGVGMNQDTLNSSPSPKYSLLSHPARPISRVHSKTIVIIRISDHDQVTSIAQSGSETAEFTGNHMALKLLFVDRRS